MGRVVVKERGGERWSPKYKAELFRSERNTYRVEQKCLEIVRQRIIKTEKERVREEKRWLKMKGKG